MTRWYCNLITVVTKLCSWGSWDTWASIPNLYYKNITKYNTTDRYLRYMYIT